MEPSYTGLYNEIKKYMPPEKRENVYKAFYYSLKAHEGQIRKSGEPYITHPIAVAIILAKQKLSSNVIIAGLLHDVVEDTDQTLGDIEEIFSKEVADIIDGVTKLKHIEDYTYDQIQAENHRKILISASKDARVLLIKLADRLHNMQTINFMNNEKQKLIANETLEVYAPIAHRLGMYEVKWELEDLSFKVLNPEAYKEIANKLEIKRSEREEIVQTLVSDVKGLLKEKNIDFKIKGRSKHIYSIYKKIEQGKHFEDIYDLFAFRVIVSTISECYIVLGIIHEHFKPIPMKFKDYIPTPKHNMYQSIHTTVLTSNAFPVEFQIRTEKMDQEAEFGIAAHWAYKESEITNDEEVELNKKLKWLRKLAEDGDEKSDSREFISQVKSDYFTKNIFIYTPRGDIIELPENSTALDFAFYVHTNLGLQAMSAKVNDKVVSLFYKLNMGDVVKIITSPHSSPSINWISKVKTVRAKDSLRKHFKEVENKKIADEGYNILLNLKNEYPSINLDDLVESPKMYNLMQHFGYAKRDKFYLAIGHGEIEIDEIVNYLHDVKIDYNVKRVVVDNVSDDYLIKLCNICSPIPGDNIKAIRKEIEGIVSFDIHREEHEVEGEKYSASFIDVNDDIKYVCRFDVEVIDSPNELLNILSILKDSNVKNITRVYARGNLGKIGIMSFSVEVSSKKDFIEIYDKLTAKDSILKVERPIINKEVF